MIFLVDFENTHASGFEGYHYLTEQDTLVVYYSDENSALQKGVVEDLKEKAVHVRMVKLLKQHSNALDMYIASTTGMFLDTGEKICIVSKDKGYAAVRDFWHSLRGAEILLGETIEECFLHSVANDDERIRRAKERNQKVQLIDAFETTNNVPTRPTLSYRNNYRRRKNQFLDLNSHLEPVELLPNPLAKEDVSYASLVEEENDGEHFSVDYSASIKEEKLFPDEEHAESFEKELSSDRATEETAANERENPDSKEEAKPADNIKSEEVKHEDSSKSSIETVNRIYLKTEKKANAGRPSNQIQYIYDPVLKRMKRVDVEEVVEDSISETGTEESKKTEEKKSSDAGKDGAVQEDASAVTESRSTEQRERQRHHNRRRRRSNGKKENGTQASGQNSNQESGQDNTKAVSQDSAKVEAKDNAKTVAKDSSKEHGKDASKEESKSIKEQKPDKQEKVESKEKSGKSDKVVKEKKSARKTGTKASQEKSAEDSAKASTKEEKKQNRTPEKKAKIKDADKSVESKTDLKTTKEKPVRKSVKAKTGEEKSETKSTRAKTAEKSDKTKAGEKTNTTKEEKMAKTKTGARTSNDKTAEKSVKAKADTKKTESVSGEKPGRRGRKKKEETKETDK